MTIKFNCLAKFWLELNFIRIFSSMLTCLRLHFLPIEVNQIQTSVCIVKNTYFTTCLGLVAQNFILSAIRMTLSIKICMCDCKGTKYTITDFDLVRVGTATDLSI